MPSETLQIAERSIASIEEPVRKEKIRKDLRDLLLDLDRKFESVLKLKGKFADDDDSQQNEEALVDQKSRSTLRRTTSHEAFPLPPRSRNLLQSYGHGNNKEMLARRHQARLQARSARNDSDDDDDDDDDEDDDTSFCSRDSSKLRSGRKRAQRVAPRTATKVVGESSTLEKADKPEAVPLSPVGTMITWNRDEELDDLDDLDEAFLFVEDYHDQDPRNKRRCSSYF